MSRVKPLENGKTRAWYRLHWGTVLVVGLVALGWMQYALPEMVESRMSHTLRVSAKDWPLRSTARDLFAPHKPMAVDSAALTINVSVALACVIAVGVVVERIERARLQFRLSSALVVMMVVALLLAFWRWDAAQLLQSSAYYNGGTQGLRKYVTLHTADFQPQVIILGGLGCLAYVSCSCLLAATSKSFSFLCRLARAKAPIRP